MHVRGSFRWTCDGEAVRRENYLETFYYERGMIHENQEDDRAAVCLHPEPHVYERLLFKGLGKEAGGNRPAYESYIA